LTAGGLLLLNVPALRFLHSAHDEAVVTAHRFNKSEIRQFLPDNGLAICRLTYWTTLLFPLAVIARTPGRRFNRAPIFILQQIHFRMILFTHVMALELPLLKRMSLPIGVALFAAARKHGAGKRN
jgi:hypothetical protein